METDFIFSPLVLALHTGGPNPEGHAVNPKVRVIPSRCFGIATETQEHGDITSRNLVGGDSGSQERHLEGMGK